MPNNPISTQFIRQTRTMGVGENLSFPCDGCRFFRVLASTADVHVSFDDGSFVPMRVGMSYRAPVSFSKITFENRSGASNAVDLVFADGDIGDDALSVANNLNVTVSRGATSRGVADVSVPASSYSALLTSISTRRRVLLVNPAHNLFPFRIGGPSGIPTATMGVLLYPGETFMTENRATVAAFNTAPYAQSITIHREDD